MFTNAKKSIVLMNTTTQRKNKMNILKKYFSKLFNPTSIPRTLHVYADSSWKEGLATFSFVELETKTFYVSNEFICQTSVVSECYGVYSVLHHAVKIAYTHGYANIIVHTDLKNLERLTKKDNYIGKNKSSSTYALFNNISTFINIHDDIDITIQYTSHKKDQYMRLVDTLAYRKSQGMDVHSHKKDVFKELHAWPIQSLVFETFEHD